VEEVPRNALVLVTTIGCSGQLFGISR